MSSSSLTFFPTVSNLLLKTTSECFTLATVFSLIEGTFGYPYINPTHVLLCSSFPLNIFIVAISKSYHLYLLWACFYQMIFLWVMDYIFPLLFTKLIIWTHFQLHSDNFKFFFSVWIFTSFEIIKDFSFFFFQASTKLYPLSLVLKLCWNRTRRIFNLGLV